jgi:hypothetical protein
MYLRLDKNSQARVLGLEREIRYSKCPVPEAIRSKTSFSDPKYERNTTYLEANLLLRLFD